MRHSAKRSSAHTGALACAATGWLAVLDAGPETFNNLVDQMEKAVKAEDTYNYHLLNLKFHDRLVEMAGNRKLTAIYRKLIKELSLFRRLNLADGWLMPISAGEHRQIVKAIASGDADAAGRAMFAHVMESKERTIENDLRRQSRLPEQATAKRKSSRADR